MIDFAKAAFPWIVMGAVIAAAHALKKNNGARKE